MNGPVTYLTKKIYVYNNMYVCVYVCVYRVLLSSIVTASSLFLYLPRWKLLNWPGVGLVFCRLVQLESRRQLGADYFKSL